LDYGKKTLVALIAILMLGLSVPAGAAAAAAPKTQSDIEKALKEQEQKYKKMQAQINSAKKKEQEAAKRESAFSKEVNRLIGQISITEQRVNVTTLRRNKILSDLALTNSKITMTSERIDKVKELLKGRMIAIYKYGGMTEFNLLMSASRAQDALATSYLLGKIAEQDKKLINDLSYQKETLERAKTELARQKQELEKQNKDLLSQKASLQRTTAERNRLLERARRDKALFQAEQAELLQASRELQGKITELLAAKKKMQEKNSGGATPLYFKGGRLAWPLRGPITSRYGTRIHPVFKTRATHTGIDISGKKGDPVRAAAPGEVLYTGWLRGYGQVIILDHGGNLTTVYAHLSGIDTNEGNKVAAGDLIGRVGSTGVTTGNHLHFEVRVNGNTADPMKYLN